MKRKESATTHRSPDGLWDLEGPVSRYYGSVWPQRIKTGTLREGFGCLKKDVDAMVFMVLWATATEQATMNVIQELKNNYDEAEKLWGNYKDKLNTFRSIVKNDVASLEAAARKTTGSVQRMEKAYGDVIALMNGEEMRQAVENAERLAAAMSSLANLQPHKLTVAVVDNAQSEIPQTVQSPPSSKNDAS